MKKLFIILIRVYQRLLKPVFDTVLLSVFGFTSKCRYAESCSHYTLRQIEERGTIRGLYLGLRRVSSCWGFS